MKHFTVALALFALLAVSAVAGAEWDREERARWEREHKPVIDNSIDYSHVKKHQRHHELRGKLHKPRIVALSELAKYGPVAPATATPAAAPKPVTPVVPVAPVPQAPTNAPAALFDGPVYQLDHDALEAVARAAASVPAVAAPIQVGAAAPVSAATSASRTSKFLSLIRSKIGSKYVFGATGPTTFDCSGLVYWAARQVGVTSIPRTASQQYGFGKAITSTAARQPGDLIFFAKAGGAPYHVGVYVGPNQMIDAPHTGAFVRQENYSYWPDKVNTARRIF